MQSNDKTDNLRVGQIQLDPDVEVHFQPLYAVIQWFQLLRKLFQMHIPMASPKWSKILSPNLSLSTTNDSVQQIGAKMDTFPKPAWL